MATYRITGFRPLVFALILATHMVVSLTAEVVAVVWFYRMLSGWMGQ